MLGLRHFGLDAGTLSVELRTIEVATSDRIPAGFETAAAGGAKALVVLPDAMFWNDRARIVALAAKHTGCRLSTPSGNMPMRADFSSTEPMFPTSGP